MKLSTLLALTAAFATLEGSAFAHIASPGDAKASVETAPHAKRHKHRGATASASADDKARSSTAAGATNKSEMPPGPVNPVMPGAPNPRPPEPSNAMPPGPVNPSR